MSELLTAEQLSPVLEKQIAPEWLAEKPHLRERLVGALTGNPDQLLLPALSKVIPGLRLDVTWLCQDPPAVWASVQA